MNQKACNICIREKFTKNRREIQYAVHRFNVELHTTASVGCVQNYPKSSKLSLYTSYDDEKPTRDCEQRR